MTLYPPFVKTLIHHHKPYAILQGLYAICAIKWFFSPVMVSLLAGNRLSSTLFIHGEYHNSKFVLVFSIVLLIAIPTYCIYYMPFGTLGMYELEKYTTNNITVYATGIDPPPWYPGMKFSDGQYNVTLIFAILQLCLNVVTSLRLLYVKFNKNSVSTSHSTRSKREIKLAVYAFLTFLIQVMDIAYLHYTNYLIYNVDDQTLANLFFSWLFPKQNLIMFFNNVWLPMFSEKIRIGLKKQFNITAGNVVQIKFSTSNSLIGSNLTSKKVNQKTTTLKTITNLPSLKSESQTAATTQSVPTISWVEQGKNVSLVKPVPGFSNINVSPKHAESKNPWIKK
uniref:Serpentine receptor class gamma n=1 Tax=Rhabditophanes sp. KR3021 TaxID=114890 RepID=A0AC35TIB4_9BILA